MGKEEDSPDSANFNSYFFILSLKHIKQLLYFLKNISICNHRGNDGTGAVTAGLVVAPAPKLYLFPSEVLL